MGIDYLGASGSSSLMNLQPVSRVVVSSEGMTGGDLFLRSLT